MRAKLLQNSPAKGMQLITQLGAVVMILPVEGGGKEFNSQEAMPHNSSTRGAVPISSKIRQPRQWQCIQPSRGQSKSAISRAPASAREGALTRLRKWWRVLGTSTTRNSQHKSSGSEFGMP
ncbi:hypothetical protein OIU85_014355 [Salix viminalis]|uniref:Uncharacterized protein n=1 Tax=Salix viminalis TaxID=40686 RepID=A0A9Q0NIL4_SALVM|nr:hypothetical protein OIU85_014355 [Salix viminalis]